MTLSTWYSILSLTHPNVASVLDLLAPVLLLLITAWVACFFLRRASAAVRHLIWSAALIGSLTMPLVRGLSLAVDAGRPLGWVGAESGVSFSWFGLAGTLWAAGSLFLTARAVVGQWSLRGLLSRAEALTDPAWRRGLESLGGSGVHLLVSEEVGSPFATGIRKRCVVIPVSLVGAHEAEVRAILTHELAHLRRWDILMTSAGLLAKIVYWPLPPVWLALRGLDLEAERACDAQVVAKGVDRPRYARQLMRLSYVGLPVQGTLAAGIGRSQMFRRLEAICGPTPPHVPRAATLFVTATIATLVFVATSRIELPHAELGFVAKEGTLLLNGSAPEWDDAFVVRLGNEKLTAPDPELGSKQR